MTDQTEPIPLGRRVSHQWWGESTDPAPPVPPGCVPAAVLLALFAIGLVFLVAAVKLCIVIWSL